MRYFLLILFCLQIFGCAVKVKYKKETPEQIALKKQKEAKAKELARKKALADEKNWQHRFYEESYFIVKNPLIADSKYRLDGICAGDDFHFEEGYKLQPISTIKFKKNQVHIKTRSGFSKKVYVTKGVCRELLYLKENLTNKKKNLNFRKSIKSMKLLYVYNVGTYVVDVTFNTQFAEVEFYVK